MFSAAKTMKKTFVFVDRERRRFLIVKWAQPQPFAPSPSQLHMPADNLNELNPSPQVIEKMIWKPHGCEFSPQDSFQGHAPSRPARRARHSLAWRWPDSDRPDATATMCCLIGAMSKYNDNNVSMRATTTTGPWRPGWLCRNPSVRHNVTWAHPSLAPCP